MPTKLPPPPHRTPFVDVNGFITQQWADFLQRVFLRVGGNDSYTNDELYTVTTDRIVDAAVTEVKLSASVAGEGLSGGAGLPLSVNVDGSTIETSADALRLKDLGVTNSKLSGSIEFSKLLSTDWSSSFGSSGYQKLGSGLVIQWGVTGSILSGATSSILFPVSFPTACRQVVVGIVNNSGVATTATGQVGGGNYSATGCDLYNRTSVTQTLNWIAVGN